MGGDTGWRGEACQCGGVFVTRRLAIERRHCAYAETNVIIKIAVDQTQTVSALLDMPANASALVVLAHGAGAGMQHAFMQTAADGFRARGLATLRYQFPYMENGSKRPDRPVLAKATVRAAVVEARRQAPTLPLFAGGKSFGGRMTSQAQAEAPLPDVCGLVFFGFPLHPAGEPSSERADHLAAIAVPILFLQGTRDALADATHIEAVAAELGRNATLEWVEDADHSFHVPARSGRTDQQVLDAMLDATAAWIERSLGGADR